MGTFLDLLKQRRIWVTVVGIVGFIAATFSLNFNFDTETLVGLLTNVGIAVSSLVTSGLALWSFLKPKK